MTWGQVWTMAGFLPTPSARRATSSDAAAASSKTISTHALREEGDRAMYSSTLSRN